jgi:hypothetical protein
MTTRVQHISDSSITFQGFTTEYKFESTASFSSDSFAVLEEANITLMTITKFIVNGDEGDYRWGFNGQEKVDEIAGVGNHNTALFWEYDTRLGRRWNIDPVTDPSQSGYACFNNNPIAFNDVNGDDPDGEPVESEYFGFLSTSSSFVNGVADGFIGALPDAAGFAYDMITSSDARADFMAGMQAIIDDPT